MMICSSIVRGTDFLSENFCVLVLSVTSCRMARSWLPVIENRARRNHGGISARLLERALKPESLSQHTDCERIVLAKPRFHRRPPSAVLPPRPLMLRRRRRAQE